MKIELLTRQSMKALLIAILMFILPALGYSHSDRVDRFGGHYDQKAGGYHCHQEPCFDLWVECVAVRDGDTIKVMYKGSEEHVRLIGVDTPKKRQPGFYEATAFTLKMAGGKTVRLEFDRQLRDRYGRLLAYVYLPDGKMLNEELIRAGHSEVYTKYPFKYITRFTGINKGSGKVVESRTRFTGINKGSGKVVESKTKWAEIIKDFLPPALAVFIGAWMAFFLESRARKKREQNEQCRAIKFAQFAIKTQRDDLLYLGDSFLSKYQSWEDAWLKLQLYPVDFSTPNPNVSELGFLLEEGEQDLLNRITNGQQGYEHICNIITLRNEALQRALPLMAAHVDVNFNDEEELKKIAGEDLVNCLRDTTKTLFLVQEELLSELESNLNGIKEFISEHFSDREPPESE